jgi:multiple sugar transport system ATP-binding protein
MSEISIQNLTKRYGDDYAAVDDVSLEIADGEFVILVGPSGSGKSTLLQMIVGLLDITEGDLHIDSERVNDKAPRDRNLAMVFQDYALYPHLTVFENIAFPLRLKKTPEEEVRRRVEDMAELLELGEFLQRKPANLSGGQRQRVAMGRAMVRDAHAFLFDEPLSNLDAKLRAQMRTEISRLQKRLGTTTVYVTHDQVEAMTLGDRLALMRKGALQQVGTPKELYERPANLFVAGFIGSPPMNLFPASVGDGVLATPFGDVPFDTTRLAGQSKQADLLVAGIRPEQLRDATRLDDGERRRGVSFRVRVDVTEWLGDEQLVYVPYETSSAVQRQLAELARELDSETPRTQLIATLDAGTVVADGQQIELALDPGDLHIFDPVTGTRLGLEPPPRAPDGP